MTLDRPLDLEFSLQTYQIWRVAKLYSFRSWLSDFKLQFDELFDTTHIWEKVNIDKNL